MSTGVRGTPRAQSLRKIALDGEMVARSEHTRVILHRSQFRPVRRDPSRDRTKKM
jgi:hypothetical protein